MKKRGDRIAKHLARLGVGSRREVEGWIFEGRVCIDDECLQTPATRVRDGQKITLDGVVVKAKREPARLWRYHKPRGLLTSTRDPLGRPTVFQSLPAELPRVISVGRLDMESEGLLLLTNDGDLARELELPASGWQRQYRVQARGELTRHALNRLNQGMILEGIRYRCRARIEKRMEDGIWLAVTLHEGKNRQIRRMLQHFGLEVMRLIRISHGPFRLALMQAGEVREVPRAHLQRNFRAGKSNYAHQRR